MKKIRRRESVIQNTDEVLIEDLREGFRQYLEVEYAHLKDKNVALSDAFYLYRHNVGIGFWGRV